MSTIIDTGLTTAALKGNFFSALSQANPLYKRLATTVASTGPSETYRWLGTVPQMRQWGSGRLARGLNNESYSVENQKYESTIEVDRDELADDQVGQIRVRVRELARRAAMHPDKLLADLMDNGASSGYNSYDGTTFFSDAHAAGSYTGQDNKLTLDATSTTAVTADEFQKSFIAACSAMLGFTDDQGEPANTELGSLVAIVPPALWYPARMALAAETLSDEANITAGQANVVVFPRLSSSVKWFLFRTDVEVRPFIFQQREAMTFNALADGSEEEFKREKHLYGVRARYAMAYGYWHHAVQTTFV